MKYLITGGAGFVGSHCAEYFAQAKKNKVIVFDNLNRSRLFGYDKKSVEYNWEYLSQYKNITRIVGDVRHATQIKDAIGNGVDVIIHTAGQPGVQYSIDNPIDDFEINTWGTLNTLEAARKKSKNTTFIFCSTNKVYGENTGYGENIVDENVSIDLTGHTPYGASKLAADLYVQEYAHLHKMKTGVFRMSCIYGTRQFGFEDQGWVAWFVIATLLNKPITIYGDGTQKRDILYVSDLVNAFDMFIKSDLTDGIFNIGGSNDNTISLLALLRYLKIKLCKEQKVSYSDWRKSDQKVYISDINKIQNELGWEPMVKIEEGLCKLISWVKENERILQ